MGRAPCRSCIKYISLMRRFDSVRQLKHSIKYFFYGQALQGSLNWLSQWWAVSAVTLELPWGPVGRRDFPT